MHIVINKISGINTFILMHTVKCIIVVSKRTGGDAAVAESWGNGGYTNVAYYERGDIVVFIEQEKVMAERSSVRSCCRDHKFV